jgi:hypothetical protein
MTAPAPDKQAQLDQTLAAYGDCTGCGARRAIATIEQLDTAELADPDITGYIAGRMSSEAQANAFRFALAALSAHGATITAEQMLVLRELERNVESYRTGRST